MCDGDGSSRGSIVVESIRKTLTTTTTTLRQRAETIGQSSITTNVFEVSSVTREIKRRGDTVDRDRRREEKIRLGDENAVDGEIWNGVVGDDDGVSGEESREAGERLQDTEVGEGETLRNDVVSDGETTGAGFAAVGGGGGGDAGGVEVAGDEDGGGEGDTELVVDGGEEIGGPVAELAGADHRLDDSVCVLLIVRR